MTDMSHGIAPYSAVSHWVDVTPLLTPCQRDVSMLTWENTPIQGTAAIMEKLQVGGAVLEVTTHADLVMSLWNGSKYPSSSRPTHHTFASRRSPLARSPLTPHPSSLFPIVALRSSPTRPTKLPSVTISLLRPRAYRSHNISHFRFPKIVPYVL